MTTAPESRAHHVAAAYVKVAAGSSPDEALLERLVADEIRKALREDRDNLRETMICDPANPCGLDNVCGHHHALATVDYGDAYGRRSHGH